jgi:ankyrin repeat protein
LLPGVTPLSSAASFGEEVVAKYLLDSGADPNKLEDSGSVALHNAARNGLSLSLSLCMCLCGV